MIRSANSSFGVILWSVVIGETLGRLNGAEPESGELCKFPAGRGANAARYVSRLFWCAHATAAVRDETPSLV